MYTRFGHDPARKRAARDREQPRTHSRRLAASLSVPSSRTVTEFICHDKEEHHLNESALTMHVSRRRRDRVDTTKKTHKQIRCITLIFSSVSVVVMPIHVFSRGGSPAKISRSTWTSTRLVIMLQIASRGMSC